MNGLGAEGLPPLPAYDREDPGGTMTDVEEWRTRMNRQHADRSATDPAVQAVADSWESQ